MLSLLVCCFSFIFKFDTTTKIFAENFFSIFFGVNYYFFLFHLPSQSLSIVSNDCSHSMPLSTEILFRFVAFSLNMIGNTYATNQNLFIYTVTYTFTHSRIHSHLSFTLLHFSAYDEFCVPFIFFCFYFFRLKFLFLLETHTRTHTIK